MDEQFTRVTTVKESQTTSTTTTGDQTWAPTGLSLQISLHPRSKKKLIEKKGFLNSLFSSRLLWVHQTWNIWTAPASMTFTRSLLLNLFLSSRDWDGWRTSKPDLCFFLCICIFFHLRSLRLTCVLFEDKANPILNLYKSKLRKKNDHNRNVVIYNYWLCIENMRLTY